MARLLVIFLMLIAAAGYWAFGSPALPDSPRFQLPIAELRDETVMEAGVEVDGPADCVAEAGVDVYAPKTCAGACG